MPCQFPHAAWTSAVQAPPDRRLHPSLRISHPARVDGARPASRRFLADGGYGPMLKPRPAKAKGGAGAVKEGDPAGAAAPPTSEGEFSLELLEQQLSTKLSTGSDDLLKWGLKTGRAECVAPIVTTPDPYPSRGTAKASRSGDPSCPAELPGWKRSRPNSHGMPIGSNDSSLKAVHSHRPRTVIAPPQAHRRIDR
ncbi:hypothetical protein AB1Y20_014444 [Prymnesium parvum]|uniref:Uncharacterized protein n=1 Tax=Prymnesium parvum TaxID=97485 RepID=A0AB34IG88_PRYPA